MALMSFTVWHQSNFPACLYLPVHISCRVILQIFQRDKECTTERKSYLDLYDKRRIRNNQDTVPYGYIDQ